MPDNPRNQETSPIRGLFRRNEEAYKKHHSRQSGEQKPDEEKREPESVGLQEELPVENQAAGNPQKKGRFSSMFGKLIEIITQPEDSALLLEDDDEGIDDIFSDISESPVQETVMQPEPVIDQEEKEPVKEELRPDEEPQADFVLPEILRKEEKSDESDEVKTVSEEPPVKPVQSVKTEISLEAILKAKDNAAAGRRVTYTASAVEVPESGQEHEIISEPIVPENDRISEKETDNSDELSHEVPDRPAEKPASKPAANELSHEAPVRPAEKPAANERSDNAQINTAARIAPSVPAGQTDFAENAHEPMVYRRTDYELIVMAGKFSGTVRGEYESTRRHRKTEKPEIPRADQTLQNVVEGAEKKTADSGSEKIKKASRTENPDKQKEDKRSGSKRRILQFTEKKDRPRFGFKLSDIFGTVDYELEDLTQDDTPVRPQLDDYGGEDDAVEIKGEIYEDYRRVVVRTIVLGITCLASLVNAFLAEVFPALFLETLRNGWLIYGVIGFLLFGISVFVSRYPIVNGLMPLRRFKGNSDTPVAVLSLAAALQSVTSLFLPNVFINGTYHVYVSLAILALLLNSIGKLLIVRRAALNFRFLRGKDSKYVGKIYTNDRYAGKFVEGLPVRRPIIAYTKKSSLMSNFLQLSYKADPVEDMSSFLAPFGAAASLIFGIAYGIIMKDFVGGVSAFALTACVTTPMCSLLAVNIPMMKLCRNSLGEGAMLSGYDSVRQFGDTNAVMLDSAQLYPKGSIILSGLKAFNDSKLDEAILAGAAVNFAVDGPLTHIFETILQNRRKMVPDVDSVLYDDDLGLSGWIGGRRILIGRRELLMKHNIEPPDDRIERKYRRMGNELSYISIGGELIAMLILTYKVDQETAHALRNLEDSGVSFVIRTIDPNITVDHVAKKFSLLPRCISILNTGLGNECKKELDGIEKTSRAYLVTNGRLSAFAAAVAGCIGLRPTIFIAKLIQSLSMGIGSLFIAVLCFISGFAKLSSLALLWYIGFWCAALVIFSLIARKFS